MWALGVIQLQTLQLKFVGDTSVELVGDTLVELIPFSDLKSHANKNILELWQSEWDEFPRNKLHEIFPVFLGQIEKK